MPRIVYGIFPSPPTRSVILTAKLIGLEITLKNVDMLNMEHKSETFRKISPTHTIPAFEDEDGFQIFDSHAIVTYIVDKYSKDDSLYPKDLKERAVVNSMLHFNNAGLWNAIALHIVKRRVFGEAAQQENEDFFKDKMTILNDILGTRAYAAGSHLTLADIFIANSLTVTALIQFNLDDYPNVASWSNRMKSELKYYDEVVAKGQESLVALFKVVTEKFKDRLHELK